MIPHVAKAPCARLVLTFHLLWRQSLFSLTPPPFLAKQQVNLTFYVSVQSGSQAGSQAGSCIQLWRERRPQEVAVLECLTTRSTAALPTPPEPSRAAPFYVTLSLVLAFTCQRFALSGGLRWPDFQPWLWHCPPGGAPLWRACCHPADPVWQSWASLQQSLPSLPALLKDHFVLFLWFLWKFKGREEVP